MRLINENDLLVAGMRNGLNTSWTYRQDTKSSHIDHVLAKLCEMATVIDTTILDESGNMIDHRALSCKLELDSTKEEPTAKGPRICWDSMETRLQYKLLVDEKMRAVDLSRDSATLVVSEVEALLRETNERRLSWSVGGGNRTLRRSRNEESECLNNRVKISYLKYRASNFEDTWWKRTHKEGKKAFQSHQRTMQRKMREAAARLTQLFNLDKRGFWREMKKRRALSARCQVSLTVLKQEYEKLFGERPMSERSVGHRIAEHFRATRQSNKKIVLERLPTARGSASAISTSSTLSPTGYTRSSRRRSRSS